MKFFFVPKVTAANNYSSEVNANKHLGYLVNRVTEQNPSKNKTELKSGKGADIKLFRMKNVFVLFALLAIGFGVKAQFKVNSSGNVGIGTNNPTRKLHVVGNSYLNGNTWIGVDQINNNNFDSYRLLVNGKGCFIVSSLNTIILKNYNYRSCDNFTYNSAAVCGTNLFLGTPDQWAKCTYSKNVYFVNPWQYSKDTNVVPCDSTLLISRVTVYDRGVGIFTPAKAIGIDKDREIDKDGDIDCGSQEMRYVFKPEQLQETFPELVYREYITPEIDGETETGTEESRLFINYTGMVPILTSVVNGQQTLIDAQHVELQSQKQAITMLQHVAFGQELDLTELFELRNTVFELRNRVYKLENMVVFCCGNTGIIRQDSISQDSISNIFGNHKSKNSGNHNNNNIQSPNYEDAILYQNTPNPFSSDTEISCNIPNAFNTAFIYVYNLQGVELKSFPITQTGFSTVMLYASELPAGMYLYVLVVDNVIADSKRMILTK